MSVIASLIHALCRLA